MSKRPFEDGLATIDSRAIRQRVETRYLGTVSRRVLKLGVELSAMLGRETCPEDEVTALLVGTTSYVREVTTFCVDVATLDGRNLKIQVDSTCATVEHLKQELSAKEGIATVGQQYIQKQNKIKTKIAQHVTKLTRETFCRQANKYY